MTEPERAERRRDPVEILLEEYLAQWRRGDPGSIEEFVERAANAHPDDAAQIREHLPELAQLAMDLESASAEPPTDAPLLEPGQTIRHYRVERYIDGGGMSEVYLAQNTKLGSNVAIKLLPARFSSDPQLLAAFEREARVAAHLDHPNIAIVHDFFEVDDRHYLVMEFVEGQSLGALLKEEKPVPLAQLLDIGTQIVRGLVAAHGRNVVHRDLKPHNVMLTPDGRAKVLDFGLAKVEQTENPVSSHLGPSVFDSGVVLGTVGYMSPEQARAQDVDARSDLFSLGVVLYQMATGKAPFRRRTFADTITAILKEQPPSASTLNPEVPVELERLIDKLLEKNPEDRYQSSEAVLEELESLGATKEQARTTRILLISASLAAIALVILWIEQPDTPAPSEPDPRIAEVTERVRRDDVPVAGLVDARDLLPELERDSGADKTELTALRALVENKIRTALRKRLATLEVELAAGRRDEADAQLEEIRKLDDAGTFRAEAEKLNEEAEEQHSAVRRLRDKIREDLESQQPDKAWTAIKSLREMHVRERKLAAATAAASEMKERLQEHLEKQLEEWFLLEDPEIKRITEYIALLKEVHPGSDQFDKRTNELRTEKVLRDLPPLDLLAGTDLENYWEVEDSEAQGIVRELTSRARFMIALDPDLKSTLTQDVVKHLDAWNAAGDAYIAFVEGQPVEDVPGADKDPVRNAWAWRKSYGQAAADPSAARAALTELETESKKLAPRFQGAARDLLERLRVAIALSEEDAETDRLIGQATRLTGAIRVQCRKRQLPTKPQRDELERLNSKKIPGVASLFASVKEAVAELEAQQSAKRERDREYEKLRKALRNPKALPGLDRTLGKLSEGWRREKRELDTAIEYRPEGDFAAADAELRWSRARVHLRLRRYSDALEDIPLSGRAKTVDGLLLSGMARFGDRQFREASKDFKDAVRADGRSARAHYWLGTLRHREQATAEALRYLEQAIEQDDGLSDAHYQVALLHANRHSFQKAIASASKNLNSRAAFSEDEMVALFADVPPAQYAERAKELRGDAYLVRAPAYFYLDKLRACIDDCDDALLISLTLGQAYYWRSAAKYKSDEYRTAHEDCQFAIKHAASEGDRDKAQELMGQIESKLK